MVVVTAKFQLLYVFVILELGSRRILQCDVTAHSTAEWTLQQFREGLSAETPYRFVIHDRDCIFSTDLDQEQVQGFGVKVLKTPPQSPQANALALDLARDMVTVSSAYNPSVHSDGARRRGQDDARYHFQLIGGGLDARHPENA